MGVIAGLAGPPAAPHTPLSAHRPCASRAAKTRSTDIIGTGWPSTHGAVKQTGQTARFTEKSTHGRAVFALHKSGNICVSTIVIGVVEGVEPDAAAIKDGKVLLGALKPYQREWWISVDCFQVPVPEGAAAPEDPDAPGAMPSMAAPDKKPAPKTAPKK